MPPWDALRMRQAATSFIGFEGENDEGEEVEKVTSIVYYVLLARNLDYLSYDWYTKSVWQLELLSICTLYLQSHLIRKRYFNWYDVHPKNLSYSMKSKFEYVAQSGSKLQALTLRRWNPLPNSLKMSSRCGDSG